MELLGKAAQPVYSRRWFWPPFWQHGMRLPAASTRTLRWWTSALPIITWPAAMSTKLSRSTASCSLAQVSIASTPEATGFAKKPFTLMSALLMMVRINVFECFVTHHLPLGVFNCDAKMTEIRMNHCASIREICYLFGLERITMVCAEVRSHDAPLHDIREIVQIFVISCFEFCVSTFVRISHSLLLYRWFHHFLPCACFSPSAIDG